jgi:hypothetical protein
MEITEEMLEKGTEVDLFGNAKGLSIRKKNGKFEIFKISTGEAQYVYDDLEHTIKVAKDLEGRNLLGGLSIGKGFHNHPIEHSINRRKAKRW